MRVSICETEAVETRTGERREEGREEGGGGAADVDVDINRPRAVQQSPESLTY